jgi:hypothetical protein
MPLVCLLVKKQRCGEERTKTCEDCQEGNVEPGIQELEGGSSAPDDAFLIEEVVDHFDAITHLDLRLFGHREDGTDQLARFDIVERRNPVGPTLFQLLSVACHGCLLFLWQVDQQFLRQRPIVYLTDGVQVA